MAMYLVLDIGGSQARVAWCLNGKIVKRDSVPTNPYDYNDSLNRIAQLVHSMGITSVVAAGVAIAGVVVDGVLIDAGNLRGWIGHDLASDFSKMLGVPVVVLNDCAAAALGEYSMLGESLIYVGAGTGLGVATASLIDGTVYARATESGHATYNDPMQTVLLPCGCGGLNHYESYLGGTNIKGRYACYAYELPMDELLALLDILAIATVSFRVSDPNIHRIVYGGGVLLDVLGSGAVAPTLAQQMLRDYIRHAVNSLKTTVAPPELHYAQHGDDAGLIGVSFAAEQLIAA